MMLGVFTSDGGVMPPFIYLYGLRLNMESYITYMETYILPGGGSAALDQEDGC